MAIRLFNSMGRCKQPLVLRVPGQVGIYVCGMTVYDDCHMGHARVMVVFDMIVRYLRACGLKVTYVRNFTDIDDKIIQRARTLGVSMRALTERYIDAFHADMEALGVAPADVEPKATEHVDEMQAMITALMENGLAYQDREGDGDVFFAVDRFAPYGKLSGKKQNDLVAGSRVEVDARKRNPLDFVLWKKAKSDEPHWASPWGEGRPGWHIECSAMSCRYLGQAFDIHGGGMDLLFPHHENEIAQTEGSRRVSEGDVAQPWVRYWLHNGFVNVLTDTGEREKMSKSLGNFHTIRDVLAHFRGEEIRFFILNSHYRSPLDFSPALLDAARQAMDRLYSSLAGAKQVLRFLPPPALPAATGGEGMAWEDEEQRFFAVMDDDFNTPRATSVLFDITKKINRLVSHYVASPDEEKRGVLIQGVGLLRTLAAILGLLKEDPDDHFHHRGVAASVAKRGQTGAGEMTDNRIEQLIQQRLEARQARQFQEADRIRQQLAESGITLQDAKDGTTWRRSG